MKAIQVDELLRFAQAALEAAGVGAEDARKMQAGGLDAKAVPTVEKEGPSWAIVNGNAAMGMVSSCRAMELAIEKAKKTGIAYVGVHNSCHFGAAGYYANLAAQQGLLGIAMSNTDPNMAIPGSRDVAIGNNPFSFAAPLKNGKSVFLDIALSGAAALKFVMARETGQQVPPGFLIDAEGLPTTDPSGFPYESHLLPMAAHKGYGFAIMVEILASVLTGAGLLSQVVSWNLDLEAKNNVGHAFIAVDLAQMLPMDEFEVRMEQMVKELESAPLAKNAQKIFVPGEMEWTKREKALAENRKVICGGDWMFTQGQALVNNDYALIARTLRESVYQAQDLRNRLAIRK